MCCSETVPAVEHFLLELNLTCDTHFWNYISNESTSSGEHIQCKNSFLKIHVIRQYRETNVMHFLFNLLRIKGLYMFRALFASEDEQAMLQTCRGFNS
jgi:hypothetical protein